MVDEKDKQLKRKKVKIKKVRKKNLEICAHAPMRKPFAVKTLAENVYETV